MGLCLYISHYISFPFSLPLSRIFHFEEFIDIKKFRSLANFEKTIFSWRLTFAKKKVKVHITFQFGSMFTIILKLVMPHWMYLLLLNKVSHFWGVNLENCYKIIKMKLLLPSIMYNVPGYRKELQIWSLECSLIAK